jgi:prepilin signal peptidase PulO-like enzyme (type II secretory pathway)
MSDTNGSTEGANAQGAKPVSTSVRAESAGSTAGSPTTWAHEHKVAVGLATGVAICVAARYGFSASGAIGGFAAAALVILAAIDIEERRLPNRIVLPSAVAVLAARLATDPHHASVWLAAAFLPAIALLVLALVYPAGLGMGDVKLALLIGATLGAAVLGGLVIGMVSAAMAAIVVLTRGGRSARKETLPYGPFLAFGALVALLVATPGS